MEVKLEIEEKILEKEIINSIANDYICKLKTNNEIKKVVADAVKELIYKRKEEIIEKCIDRASKELVRKGLPKLLEKGIE